MPKLTATSGIDIEDGTYEATLLDIQVAQPTEKSPNQNEWLKWIFQVYDGSQDGVEMMVGSSFSFSTKSKARGWVEALLARKMERDEEIDTDTLCPKECQVTVKLDLDSGFKKIIDVMAPRKRPTPGRPAQGQAPARTQAQAPARPRPAAPPAPAQGVDGVEVGDEEDIPF